MKRLCGLDGCEKPAAKGMRICPMHLARMKRTGSYDGIYPQGDPYDRLMHRVTKVENGCWVVANPNVQGYGTVGSGGRQGPKILAHRFMYEKFVGPIPDGFEVHHRCHNRACCNPAHLEAITKLDHIAEHKSERCRRGHDDWRIKPSGDRECRECRRERERAKRQAA